MHFFTTYSDYFFEHLPPPNPHFFYINARKLNIFSKQFLKYGLNHVNTVTNLNILTKFHIFIWPIVNMSSLLLRCLDDDNLNENIYVFYFKKECNVKQIRMLYWNSFTLRTVTSILFVLNLIFVFSELLHVFQLLLMFLHFSFNTKLLYNCSLYCKSNRHKLGRLHVHQHTFSKEMQKNKHVCIIFLCR